MDLQVITTFVSTVGFPIAMTMAMAYFVKYTIDQNNARIDKMNEQHQTEMDRVTEALNNNTLAIQHLTDIMAYAEGGKDVTRS